MKFRLKSYYHSGKPRYLKRTKTGKWAWGNLSDSHLWDMDSEDWAMHTKNSLESHMNTRLVIDVIEVELPEPYPLGSPEHEAMLESLILLGLDPDHVEILRTWPVTTLADFAFSLTDIIQRARNEAIAEVKAPKTA